MSPRYTKQRQLSDEDRSAANEAKGVGLQFTLDLAGSNSRNTEPFSGLETRSSSTSFNLPSLLSFDLPLH